LIEGEKVKGKGEEQVRAYESKKKRKSHPKIKY